MQSNVVVVQWSLLQTVVKVMRHIVLDVVVSSNRQLQQTGEGTVDKTVGRKVVIYCTIEDVKPFDVSVKFVVHHGPCHQLGYPLFIHLWWWE